MVSFVDRVGQKINFSIRVLTTIIDTNAISFQLLQDFVQIVGIESIQAFGKMEMQWLARFLHDVG